MAKKKLPVSIVELVWYPLCAAVILWGVTYVVLGLVNKYNDFSNLDAFCKGFKNLFKLDLYYWGLIIIAIAVVAAVIVMLVYAKTFDRAADREQRRSARLNALRKEEKVVAEQQPEVVEAPKEEEATPQYKIEAPEEKAE